jgi:predicted MFS family arabinose efflux permease
MIRERAAVAQTMQGTIGDTAPGHVVEPVVGPVPGRTLALVLLTMVGTLNFVDRTLLSVLVEPIRADLEFSDTEFGLLTGLAFALFYAVMGLPAAMIADRWHRIRLIGMACLAWSAFTAVCGMAGSFWQLALARVGVGVGEAGGTAPSLSVLSDYYPPDKRPLVTGLFTVNGPLGVFIGAALGGWAAQQFGWRGAFYAVGALGLIAVPLLLVFVREPVRGGTDPVPVVADVPVGLGTAFGLFVRKRSLAMLLVASGLNAFVSYGMLNWIPAFLMRSQGMPLSGIAQWYAPAAGIAFAIGIWGGGALVNLGVRRTTKAYAIVPAIASLVLVPSFLAALWMDSWQASLALLMIPMACCNVYVAPALSLTQNLTPPRARAVSAAILLLTFNIVGLGLGPLFVGMVSDAARPAWGDASVPFGMSLLMPFAILAIVAQFGVARAIVKDLGDRT